MAMTEEGMEEKKCSDEKYCRSVIKDPMATSEFATVWSLLVLISLSLHIVFERTPSPKIADEAHCFRIQLL